MTKMRFTGVSALVLAALAAGQATAARAQEGGAPPARDQTQPAAQGAQGSPANPADILVTARRKEERLLDVPSAITALSGDTLQAAGVVKIEDVPLKTPGLSIQASSWGNSVPGFTIRSQRKTYPYLINDSSVVVYFADIPQSRPYGLNSVLYDLADVQVLKGPQGTLFGRNSTGGAVLIEPAAPGRDFGGYVKATGGNYGLWAGEGVVNVPLTDTLQARVSGVIRRRDGYVHNLTTGERMDDERSEAWRASVNWQPIPTVTNLLVMNGYHEHDASTGYRIDAFSPTGLAARLYPDLIAEYGRLSATDVHETTSDISGDNTRVRTFGISNKTTFDLGEGIQIRNIFGYRYVHSHVFNDYDGTSKAIFDAEEGGRSRQLSDELHLLGTSFEDHLNWIVGGFLFKEYGTLFQTNYTLIGTPSGKIQTYPGEATNRSVSGFGQATLKVPGLEALALTAGLRYTHDSRDFESRAHDVTTGVCLLLDDNRVPLNPCHIAARKVSSQLTYELNAAYTFTHDVMAYVTHRRGYRPGGFWLGIVYPEDAAKGYQPETVQDFEAGFKAARRIGGVRANLTIAAYHQNYRDIQRSLPQLQNGVTVFPIVNAGRARINGVEVEAGLSSGPVALNGFYALSDSKYLDFKTAAGVDLSYNHFPYAPRQTFGGDVTFTLARIGDGKVNLRADVYHQTKSYLSTTNQYATGGDIPGTPLTPFTLVNGRLGWTRLAGMNLDAELWARNLFNKRYIVSGTSVFGSYGVSGGLPGAPRTYGLDLRYSF